MGWAKQAYIDSLHASADRADMPEAKKMDWEAISWSWEKAYDLAVLRALKAEEKIHELQMRVLELEERLWKTEARSFCEIRASKKCCVPSKEAPECLQREPCPL